MQVDRGGKQGGDLVKKIVIERFGSVGWKVVIRISEFGGIGPHDRGDFLMPKRSVVAAGEDGKSAFRSGDHFEASDGQLRGAEAALPEDELHGGRGLLVGQEAEKIAGVTQFDRQAGRNILRAGSIGGKTDHLEDVGAFETHGWMILRDKFATAEETIFLAIERDEHDGQVRGALGEG